jgi:hypothetical protein
MKNAIMSGLVVVAMGLLAPKTVWSQGTLYVSSLDQPSAGSAAVGSDSWLAAWFRTGSNPGGYVLDSVQLDMTPGTGDPSGFTVQLYTGVQINGAVLPGSSLATLTGSSEPVAASLYTYTASDLTLSSYSDYYIVLTAGTPVASGAYVWSFDNSTAVTSGGWSGSDYLFSSSDGSSWNSHFEDPQFSLTATAVPEPEPLYLLGLPGLLFFAWRRWRARAQAR